ncbi:hypothetical protein [Pseudomonas oryzae]|uniref:Uncharacterized protein n=1 Tax=Pseudomonas oryzae TaxID=1392877 RepID=A0A1H1LMX4_9PSED|nr:hypothetical protein [Pseudomonas oryzae]SDR75846.1 hypothetical protein SAMN05216221_0227 [Pseudomonas oryzae]
MKIPQTCLLLVATAVALPGCAGRGGEPRQILDVPLRATQHNAGEIARASLTGEDGRTGIVIFVGGVPDGTSRPVHLYTYLYPGRCERLGPAPAWELNRIVLASRVGFAQAGWRLNKWLEVPLAQLRSGGYSLVVRASPADGGYDLFCGEID